MLDVGKTSVKLTVTDREGCALESHSRPSRVIAGPPYPHADTEGAWDWILTTLHDLGTRHPIGCIVPVAHGACAALVNEHDLALPILDYELDLSEVDAEYEPLARDFEQTGSPKLPCGLNLGRQLFWLERHHAEAFDRARYILTHPQYWAFVFPESPAARSHRWGAIPISGRRLADAFRHSPTPAATPRAFRRLSRLGIGWDRSRPTSPNGRGCAAMSGTRWRARLQCFVFRAPRSGYRSFHRRLDRHLDRDHRPEGDPIDALIPERDMLANVDALGDPVACCRFMGGREYHALAGDEGLAAIPDVDSLSRILTAGVMARPQFADQGGPFQGSVGSISPESWKSTTPIERAALATLYTALAH